MPAVASLYFTVEQNNMSDGPGKDDPFGQPGPSGQPNQPGAVGQPGSPGQTDQPGAVGQPGPSGSGSPPAKKIKISLSGTSVSKMFNFIYATGSPVFQHIAPVTPAEQQDLPLSFNPGYKKGYTVAQRRILTPTVNSIITGHLIDPPSLFHADANLRLLLGSFRFCPPVRYIRIPSDFVPTEKSKSFLQDKPKIKVVPDAKSVHDIVIPPPNTADFAMDNMVEFLQGRLRHPHYRTHGRIAFLPCVVGEDQVFCNMSKAGDQRLMQLFKQNEIPSAKDHPFTDTVSMEMYILGLLPKLLELKNKNLGEEPEFRYKGFVAPIEWRVDPTDKDTHVGVFYFGPVKKNRAAEPETAACFVEPHKLNINSSGTQCTGHEEPIPVQALSAGLQLGRDRIFRFFSHQEKTDNCCEWMIAALDNLVFHNMVPRLDQIHQEILLPDCKVGSKTQMGKTGKQDKVFWKMPDWMLSA